MQRFDELSLVGKLRREVRAGGFDARLLGRSGFTWDAGIGIAFVSYLSIKDDVAAGRFTVTLAAEPTSLTAQVFAAVRDADESIAPAPTAAAVVSPVPATTCTCAPRPSSCAAAGVIVPDLMHSFFVEIVSATGSRSGCSNTPPTAGR